MGPKRELLDSAGPLNLSCIWNILVETSIVSQNVGLEPKREVWTERRRGHQQGLGNAWNLTAWGGSPGRELSREGAAGVLEAGERTKQRGDPKLPQRWWWTKNHGLKEPMSEAKGFCHWTQLKHERMTYKTESWKDKIQDGVRWEEWTKAGSLEQAGMRQFLSFRNFRCHLPGG